MLDHLPCHTDALCCIMQQLQWAFTRPEALLCDDIDFCADDLEVVSDFDKQPGIYRWVYAIY